MIDHATTDILEEAIDCFEENWSPRSGTEISHLLQDFGLGLEPNAITELVRIDIEMRHKQGIEFQLDDYFREFRELLTNTECVGRIAFEDYRSHLNCGRAISAARWRHLPGVKDLSWFKTLQDEASSYAESSSPVLRLASTGTESMVENALRDIGFQLVKEIGQGAFSKVYLATQDELANRYVVLKIVDQPITEPQSMAMLQHTNIVPIYSFHQIGRWSVICMPYAGSVTLAAFLRNGVHAEARSGESLLATVRGQIHEATTVAEGKPPESSSRDFFARPAADERAVLMPLEQLRTLDCPALAGWMVAKLASALAHSHARGILHGDLKPGNVLIRNDGEPALLDFNLAQSLDRRKSQYVGGTLPYMAPESYRALMGQTIATNGASDIYSLGIILFEFLTGRLPYPTPNSSAPIDLEAAIDARRMPPDWRSSDRVPTGMRCIINHAIAFLPKSRYQSAEQLQEDLERERNHLPLVHTADPITYRARKWFLRHPRILSGGSVAVLSMLVLLPVISLACVWRQHSIEMAAATRFNDFENASTEVLFSAMLDPERNTENGIQEVMKPLEQFGILDDDGLDQFDWQHLNEELRLKRRAILLRHLLQTGIAESQRLVIIEAQGELTAVQLARLDQILDVADRVRGDIPSRAFLFLKSQFAKFSRDLKASDLLRAKAANSLATSDTEVYLEASRLMIQQSWGEASALLTSLADRNTIPSSLRWTMLGRSQYSAGDYENAKISFTQSIERVPRSAMLRLLRGRCYRQLGATRDAEADMTKAIQLDQNLVSAWTSRALVRLAEERGREGLSDLHKALELSPGNAQTLLLRSRAFRRMGNDSEADRDFAAAMEAKNLSPDALISRAIARKDHDAQAALVDLQRALSMDPNSTVILVNIANVLATRLDQRNAAIDVLGKALELDPNNERALVDQAVLYALDGEYAQALEGMTKAIAPPNTARTLYQAACVCALTPGASNKTHSLSYLSQAIQAGYDADRLSSDPDLESIRHMPGFLAIQRTYQLAQINNPELQKSNSFSYTE